MRCVTAQCGAARHRTAAHPRGVNEPRVDTSSVLVAEVREPPDVAEADAVADARKDEVHLRRPLFPRRNRIVLVGHLRLGRLARRSVRNGGRVVVNRRLRLENFRHCADRN